MKLNQDDASAKVKLSWLRHPHLAGLCVGGSIPVAWLFYPFLTLGFMVS